MKHKNYEMITSKVANMDLIIFARSKSSDSQWFEASLKLLVSNFDNDYFLCLPQHTNVCFHFLVGGRVEFSHDGVGFGNWNEPMEWSVDHAFMSKSIHSRIKPKKKKRWIGYCANTNQTFPHPQKSKEVAEDYAARNYGYKMSNWQFIEIEVEV